MEKEPLILQAKKERNASKQDYQNDIFCQYLRGNNYENFRIV